jgi:hypothetical protein
MSEINLVIERSKFQDYIFQSWDSSKHNFSMDEDGGYIYRVMEDAWWLWIHARELSIFEMEEKNDRRN